MTSLFDTLLMKTLTDERNAAREEVRVLTERLEAVEALRATCRFLHTPEISLYQLDRALEKKKR